MEEDPDHAKLIQMLAAARKEAADAALEKAGERLTNQTNNVSKLRMEFFDRLVLLDGGTISLSLTLIGLLQRTGQPSTHCHFLLFSAWGCFLFSLMLAMIRNWREPDRLMAAEGASYALIVHESLAAFAQQVESLGVPASDSIAQDVLRQGPEVVSSQRKRHNELNEQNNLTGGAALILALLGYALLLGFAVVNSAALLMR